MKGRQRGPNAIVAPVDFGTAQLVPDAERPGGWLLLIDGAPQSYVDVGDPTYLQFEYMRRLATVIEAAGPPGAPLHALHLGGGALTLARYLAATRPGSRQRVVESDAALVDLVRRVLPLPRRADLRVRTDDARAAVESLGDARFDLVITDIYRDARMPRSVASAEFTAQVARVLRPAGLYAVNVADVPPLAFTRAYAATVGSVFADVAVIADPMLFSGRRMGNAVVVAARQAGGVPATRLAAAASADRLPGRLLHGDDLRRFVSGAAPMTDATASDSPVPASTRPVPRQRRGSGHRP